MGVVLIENILKHLDEAPPDENRLEVVYRACTEVGSAVVTAVLTTVISFLPVFTMEAAEGKLFRPLAYTKTFALIGSIVVALTIIPPLAHWFIATKKRKETQKDTNPFTIWLRLSLCVFAALLTAVYLAGDWRPLGPGARLGNVIFVLLTVGSLLGFFYVIIRFYSRILTFLLRIKAVFLAFCALILVFGFTVWLGWSQVFGWLPDSIRKSRPYVAMAHILPGLGKEFMPALDEGSYLLMPTTMPHASIGEVMDVLSKQDRAIKAIPEVESVVGKLGRVESPLDPAPISMIETIITYKSEFVTDCQSRNDSRNNFRSEASTDCRTHCYVAKRYAGSDGTENLRTEFGNPRKSSAGDRRLSS